MKKSLVLGATVALALAMSGCGVDVPSPGKYVDEAKSAAASAAAQASQEAQAAQGDGSTAGDPNAAICADAGTPGMRSLALGLQFLAQPNLDTLGQIRDGNEMMTGLFDTAGIDQGIKDYRVLDGHPAPGFKDPKETLDKWQDLNGRMAAMITSGSEPTQVDIDSYTTAMGDQQSLIMSQVDVAVARDEYCQG